MRTGTANALGMSMYFRLLDIRQYTRAPRTLVGNNSTGQRITIAMCLQAMKTKNLITQEFTAADTSVLQWSRASTRQARAPSRV
eukprot:6313711-Heterocapsa_arctica.AAC.2